MACGVPVVASKVASIQEVIENAGFLCNTPEEMAEYIAMLIEDRELRKNIAKKTMERTRKFTWEKRAKDTIKVCEAL